MSATPMTDALVAELRRRGVEVLTHADWGSIRQAVYRTRLSTRPHDRLPGRPVDTLWNHITVTFDDGHLVGDFKADMREVERIGFERFGTGVSYNVLVDANASRPRVALGQFLEARGAHTINDKGVPGYSLDQNRVSLAVAWVGVPGDRLNEHAIEAMAQTRAALIEIGALTRDYDDVPHSLVAAKDCPTDELRNRLADLKATALNLLEDDMISPEDRAAIVKDFLDAPIAADGRTVRKALRQASKAPEVADQVAKRVAALLLDEPGDIAGTFDAEQIKAAVKQALREGTDD